MALTVILDLDIEAMLRKEVRRCGEPGADQRDPRRVAQLRRRDDRFAPLTFDRGKPRVELTKAALLAAELEADAIIGRYRRGRWSCRTSPRSPPPSTDQHAAVLRALRQGFDDPRGGALAWPALLACLRVRTPRGIVPGPRSVDDALRVIDHGLGHPQAPVVYPGERLPRSSGDRSSPPAPPAI